MSRRIITVLLVMVIAVVITAWAMLGTALAQTKAATPETAGQTRTC